MSENDSSEIWKAIEGFPGYEVSNLGNIRSNRTNWGLHPLRPYPNFRGYSLVTLCINYQKSRHSLHKLVAQAFIGPVPNGMTVNHRNGIKTDNRVNNLEIVSLSENVLHAYRVLGRERPKPEHVIHHPTTKRLMGTLKRI